MHVRKWCLPLAALLLVSACGGGGGGGEEEAVSTTTTTESTATTEAETTTTTEEEVDPFTVPDDPADITEAYVEAVANELYAILGQATVAQRDGAPVAEMLDAVNAIYDSSTADRVLNQEFEYADQGFPGLLADAAGATFEVVNVRIADPDACLVADALQDVSQVVEDPPPPNEGVLVLRLKNPESDPRGLNPTDWALVTFATPSTYQGVLTCDEL